MTSSGADMAKATAGRVARTASTASARAVHRPARGDQAGGEYVAVPVSPTTSGASGAATAAD